MVKPKKHLGQHFLTETQIAKDIASLSYIDGIDYLMEIGPGEGVLTQYLMDFHKNKLEVIEIDSESVEHLHAHFDAGSFKITNGDFLKLDIHHHNNLGVIGNYPYNISSQIAFKVLDNMANVEFFGGMFQKEVAERLATKHGTKKYGILSVLLQAYYEVEYCFSVPNTAFNPPPKVESGVIKAVKRKAPLTETSYKILKTVVKAAFSKRRKMLNNSLKGLQISALESSGFAKLRPEQMSVQDFCDLAKIYQEELNGRK